MIGRSLRRLKAQGMYDNSLIVVTADHGISWQPGVGHAQVGEPGSNVEELTPVPLIVKRPGQRRGRISDAYARTLDVTPTIADVLDVPLGYRADGRSAFGRAARRRRTVRLDTRDFSSVVRISGRRWEARRRQVVRRRLREFGSGDGGLYTGIGPHRDLLGRSAARAGAGGRRPACAATHRRDGRAPARAARAPARARPDRGRPDRRAARRATRRWPWR